MKFVQFIIFCFLILVLSPGKLFGQYKDVNDQYSGERILKFQSDIEVQGDASLIVTEKIKVYATGDVIRRGITRMLPGKRNINNSVQNEDYKMVYVTRDGKKEKYKMERKSSNTIFYFGDSKKLLKPGVYEYEFQYKIKNQIGYFENFDELYWNVNGNFTDFPTDTVFVTINFPKDAEISQYSCYTGLIGSTEQNCMARVESDNQISWGALGFKNKEGLTVSAAIQKGIIDPPPVYKSFLENWIFGLMLVAFIGLLTYMYKTWRKYGVDPEKPVVVPQYFPPEGLSPGVVSFIHSEGHVNRSLTASLIDMAIKGFLKIEEIKGSKSNKKSSFIIRKIQNSALRSDELPEEQKILYEALPDETNLSNDYDADFKSITEKYYLNIWNRYNQLLDYENSDKKQGNKTGWFVFIVGLFFLLISIFTNPFLDVAFKPIPLGLSFIAIAMYMLAYRDYKIHKYRWYVTVILLFLLFLFCIPDYTDRYDLNFISAGAFLISGFIAVVWYDYLIVRPPVEKVRIQSLIKGLKIYITKAEAGMMRKFNPPEITPEVFERLLPYAVVLDVDKIWGKTFNNKIQKTAYSYSADWYSGSDNLSSVGLTSNISNSFLYSIIYTANQRETSYGSSYSGGGSGSGGGGHSGGGGGGGGVGGW